MKMYTRWLVTAPFEIWFGTGMWYKFIHTSFSVDFHDMFSAIFVLFSIWKFQFVCSRFISLMIARILVIHESVQWCYTSIHHDFFYTNKNYENVYSLNRHRIPVCDTNLFILRCFEKKKIFVIRVFKIEKFGGASISLINILQSSIPAYHGMIWLTY